MEQLWGISISNFIYKFFTNILAKYIEPYAENISVNFSAAFVQSDQKQTIHLIFLCFNKHFFETNKQFDIKHSMGFEKGFPFLH